ncbi:hypothetical protein [Demequina lignilytica]|uniref:Uncharacterized protein n=1 Tax=Demequina lignilytica TaxID=3051663 RepID=A0AB35MJL6_9MICO|nr:hypothetical protein [Demequina sp. SYSU T0a273]MDN4483835.1 hypothetical protein [Demequina sp. SYSU T0a273]
MSSGALVVACPLRNCEDTHMNKALIAALVGVLGLALGFGAGWAWDSVTGDEDASPTPSASASP